MKKIDTNTKEEMVVDAQGKALGRLATEISFILSGKNKATFERNIYSGAPVKVVNASKIKTNTKRLEGISHKRYSGYPGGLTILSGSEVIGKKGFGELIKHAVYQMLPGNKLRREMMKNLKIEE
ncbi:MAG TPA: 50S ribosomal protein L13 [Candidatus Paceibacterota bacterium]|nr:50S ribosomal protein L13 [Candidatus Paceibacterota bacterium]